MPASVQVDLHAMNTYTGVYVTDTFDITNSLSVTAGGRFNLAQIDLEDQTGLNPLLNSNNRFQRFNPVIGRDLQSHAEPDRLCRLFGKPTARRRRSNSDAPTRTILA